MGGSAGRGTPVLVVGVAESGPAGPVAPRLPLAFESLLYLRPEHQALQAWAGPVLSFYLEDPAAGRTVAQLLAACPDVLPVRRWLSQCSTPQQLDSQSGLASPDYDPKTHPPSLHG